MLSNRKTVFRFLEKIGMHPEAIVLKDIVPHMLEEMRKGLVGESSSLAMIPTFIDADHDIPSKKPSIVMDAGGTNLRVALLSFSSEREAIIEKFQQYPMPGTQGKQLSKENFFAQLAQFIEPLLPEAEKIGFCFSYPTEIFPNKDGRLIQWTKEVKVPEVEGALIGANLRAALRERGYLDPPEILILSDTVATLLSGKAATVSQHWGGYVGFILGTGTNSCYLESNKAIMKLPDCDVQKNQIINCESGNYACPYRGNADQRLGENTSKPGGYWLEKMLAGAYFGALTSETIALAGESGLFSPAMVEAFSRLGKLSTKEADSYAHNPHDMHSALVPVIHKHGTKADAERLCFLIDFLLERAARLCASNLAATTLKSSRGKGPLHRTCLSIDGTTFYRYHRFRTRVENYLQPFLLSHDQFYEIVKIDNAPLIGAAVAALTN